MTAEDRLIEAGYEGTVCFSNFSYDDALIGVSSDGRAIYDYNKMVEWIVETEGWDEIDAIEWIDFNTIRALPYGGPEGPIVMYPLD